MFKTNLKNKRGFSLVELMVVVAIMGTLAAIAIPAYNEYRKSAKKSAYKADLTSLHKGWLAFGVELDSFCERRTNPKDASIKNVGMESLFSSKLYGSGPSNKNFIGFGAQHGSEPCTLPIVLDDALNNAAHGIYDVSGSEATACVLGITEYKMGVAGHVSGENFVGFAVNQSGVIEEEPENNWTTINAPTGVCA